MDAVTPSETLPDLTEAAMSAGEMMLIFLAIVLTIAAVVVGTFLLFNENRGRSRASRTSREREEARLRSHRDLLERIRSYARRCEEDVTRGIESPDEAARALQHYGDGVLDSVMAGTRNVKQIERIRQQVEDEMARLRAITPI